MDGMSETWPLFDLIVSSPRVTLRYVTDEFAERAAELAADGIHDPATMPFSEPWTDVDPPELQRNSMRYFWRCRAGTTPAHWDLNLAVNERGGDLVGVCTVHAQQFPTTRTATTGSWLGRRHQGRGLGREMRHAALHLIFEGLSGEHATTRAWHDNIPSLGVTRSLPYTEGRATEEMRRDRTDTMLSFSMTRAQWEPVRRNDIDIQGLAAVRAFLEL